MRIIDNWQYRYIEKCLYGFDRLLDSELQTERAMIEAIQESLEFFKGTAHEVMIREYYFKAEAKTSSSRPSTVHLRYVCDNLLHTDYQNGFVIRREIVYRIAMNCYALDIFQFVQTCRKL